MIRTILRTGMVLAIGATVSACGTTYTLPEVTDGSVSEATRMFQEERADGASGARSSSDQAARNFIAVASRIEPIAERFCEEQTAEIADFSKRFLARTFPILTWPEISHLTEIRAGVSRW